MKQLVINNQYYINGKAVIFLGNQDVKHFGFFRMADHPDTFFGYRLSKVRKTKDKN